MVKSTCKLEIDIKIIDESNVIKDFGMEKILETKGEYLRTSGKKDVFIINYSDGTSNKPELNKFYHIVGELRNVIIKEEDNSNSYSKVYILAKEFTELESEPSIYANEIIFDNVELLNKPDVRKSFKDETTDITDIKIRIQRNVEKFDIVKCTCWNNNARLIKNYDKGSLLNIIGRLQSRVLRNGGIHTEVSVNSISIVENDGGD